MPDVEQEEKPRKEPSKWRQSPAGKAAQAKAHKKWRESEKGRAYLQRLKERKALGK